MAKNLDSRRPLGWRHVVALLSWPLLLSCSSQTPDERDPSGKSEGESKAQVAVDPPKSVRIVDGIYQLLGCGNNNAAAKTLSGSMALYEPGGKPVLLFTSADSKEYRVAVDDDGSRWLASRSSGSVKIRGVIDKEHTVVPMAVDESGAEVPMKMSELYSSDDGNREVMLGMGDVLFLKACQPHPRASTKQP